MRAFYGGFHHPETRVRGDLDVIVIPLPSGGAHTNRHHSGTKTLRFHAHRAMVSIFVDAL